MHQPVPQQRTSTEKSNPELVAVTAKLLEATKTAEQMPQTTQQPGSSGKQSAEKKPSAIPTPRKSIEKKTVEIKASPRKTTPVPAESPRKGNSTENLKASTTTPKK